MLNSDPNYPAGVTTEDIDSLLVSEGEDSYEELSHGGDAVCQMFKNFQNAQYRTWGSVQQRQRKVTD